MTSKITVYCQNNIPLYYEVTHPKVNNFNPTVLTLSDFIRFLSMYGTKEQKERLSVTVHNYQNINFITVSYEDFPIHLNKSLTYKEINSRALDEIKQYFNDEYNVLKSHNVKLSQASEPYITLLNSKDNISRMIGAFLPNNQLAEEQPISSPVSKVILSMPVINIPKPADKLTREDVNLEISEHHNVVKDFTNMNDDERFTIFEGDKPNTAEVSKMWTVLMNEYGVPFSISRIKEIYQDINLKVRSLDEVIIDNLSSLLNTEIRSIDYTSRLINDRHIGNYLIAAGIIPKSHLYNKTISLKLESLSVYINNLEDKLLEFEANVDDYYNPQKEILEKHLSILNSVHSYLKSSKIKSNITKIYNSIVLPNSKNTYKCDIDEDKDIALFKTKTSALATNRIQVVQPNFQGLQPSIKECIGYTKDNYNIMAMDIKGQDTHMLIFGVLKDKKLSELVIKHGDPILGILEACNIEPTPQNRKVGKVPVLSIMNGKSLKTLLNEAKNEQEEELMKIVYYYIVNNPNYKNVLHIANELYRTRAKTKKCLLGVENEISYTDDKGNKRSEYNMRNSLLNVNFQMTSASIFNLCTQNFMYDLINGNIKYKDEIITLEHIRPIVPVFDEIIISYKDGYEELAEKLLNYYFLPNILDWDGELKGEITKGKMYIHK